MIDFLSDYTLRNVVLGSATLGVVSGVLGSFAVLRRQSLLGDAISHAALPGIVAAYMLTRSRTPGILLAGAAVAGAVGAAVVSGIVRNSRLKYDSALGIVLSVFFGIGLVLLTFVQRGADAGQAGLENFLFGQAASLVAEDVTTMALLGGMALLLTTALWKEFKILSFDPGYATSLGFSTRTIDLFLTGALVAAIVIGLQTVGVILMSALVIAPGVAARQWTSHLGTMVLLAAIFGAISGTSGAVVSASIDRLPTGPAIVVCASGLVVLSLIFAPRYGWVTSAFRRSRQRTGFKVRSVLDDLETLSHQHADAEHGHPIATIEAMGPSRGPVGSSLEALQRDGFVKRRGDDWMITDAGKVEAERARAEGRKDRA